MTARRTLAALLVATVLSAVGASSVLADQQAQAATLSPATLVVAPDSGGIVHAGSDLGVDVTVTNTGPSPLSGGRLTFSLDDAPVAGTATLLSSLATPPAALQGQLAGATADVRALAAGASETVRTTIGKTDLSTLLSSTNGTRRLYVQYLSGLTRTIAVSSVVKIATGAKASIGLATTIPVLAPAGTTGIVDIATQQLLTAPDGAWSRALRAARADPTAAIELDPAVLASIRIAGAAAPPAAGAFLAELGRLPNEFLRLPYADTDVTLQRAAGVTSSLDPASFAGVALTGAAGGAATPAPTATAGTTPAATTGLTDWNWSDRHVTWPLPRTTSAADLVAFGRTGQVLLSSDDLLNDTPARRAAGPVARIGSARVLVSDATTSALLATASSGGAAGRSALATITGLLATAAVTGETTAVLATVGRSTDTAHLDQVLGLLGSQTWIRSTTLGGLGDGRGAATVRLRGGSVPSARVATARSLVAGERAVDALGKAIVSGADTVTAPQRLALLGALASGWRGDDVGWRSAADAVQQGFTKVLAHVQLAEQSPPNLIGSDGTLPVIVTNTLPAAVRVTVHAGVSNGAVQFTNPDVTIVVPAGGRAPARLGFRSIRNGRTDLTLTLTTPAGAQLGSKIVRSATVQAGFDTIVAVVLLTALGLLLALGVYRNVKRRRQPRVVAA